MLLIQEEIEIKKDTGRADEIRAMKRAWEEAEPGRAAKVCMCMYMCTGVMLLSCMWGKLCVCICAGFVLSSRMKGKL